VQPLRRAAEIQRLSQHDELPDAAQVEHRAAAQHLAGGAGCRHRARRVRHVSLNP